MARWRRISFALLSASIGLITFLSIRGKSFPWAVAEYPVHTLDFGLFDVRACPFVGTCIIYAYYSNDSTNLLSESWTKYGTVVVWFLSVVSVSEVLLLTLLALQLIGIEHLNPLIIPIAWLACVNSILLPLLSLYLWTSHVYSDITPLFSASDRSIVYGLGWYCCLASACLGVISWYFMLDVVYSQKRQNSRFLLVVV